jgi:UBA/TS-N domain
MSSASLLATMRTPSTQGRPTPPSSNGHASNPPSKPATPANDSFANLVPFGASGVNNKNMSLLEQQKQLQEQKAKQEAERRRQQEAQYGGQNTQFWDTLGQDSSARSTPPAPAVPRISSPDEDDILAAFDAAAPVDASTNFPVPSSRSTDSSSNLASRQTSNNLVFGDDDDDPFGLGKMQSKPTVSQPVSTQREDDDDDFLGLLGKPVSESARANERPKADAPAPAPTPPPKAGSPLDRAVAELVDMGFPPEKAAQALESTESGVDVQAAVGWLLNQAHAESRQKTRAKAGLPPEEPPTRRREDPRARKQAVPSWMKESESEPRHRGDSRSPVPRDRDVGELASNFGNQLFKTANSLWKTGSKKVQQAVHDFNSEADSNQPRWMREPAAHPSEERGTRPPKPPREEVREEVRRDRDQPERTVNMTDEAMLLESDVGRPARHTPRRPDSVEPRRQQQPAPFTDTSTEGRETRNPSLQQKRQQPQPQPQQPRRPEPRSQLTRGALEEQSAQAYVSPARRRRPQAPAKQESPLANEDNAIDLLDSSKPQAQRPSPSTVSTPSPPVSKPRTPLPTRPKAPVRNIPSVSQSALLSSHNERESGNAAYKRGDYAAAHDAFTKALSHLPTSHPVTILVLSNHAMTALKIGEPKVTISDADTILAFIGPSKGEGETIEPGNGQSAKPMKDFFGKALMRKAEALEHLEKWVDAAQVWKEAVESGHGGSTSIQGRNRCEKAAGISKPNPPPTARPSPARAAPVKKTPVAPRRSALSDLSGQTAPTGEAVTRLRAANEAAERADEEKLALTDSVDAKLSAWKDGKQDNLRALLGSLDNVLWPESGWKKINMSELILPNKVKIQYMKGIAKVHPDKVGTYMYRFILEDMH